MNAGFRYVGIDLAWGERSRTGVALLEESGRLQSCASVVTDDDIAGCLPWDAGALVVAVDAPLIVRNETGQRRAERRVGQLFGWANASAHTSNRGRPAFRPEPRGARLARRFGWTMDPRVRPTEDVSVCIEVYPHPAMVVLFELDTVIKYKAKPGRALEDLRSQHLILLDHMERVAGSLLELGNSADWQRLRATVEDAVRKVDLRVAEDQVDAVFCAYLAWLWTNDRAAMMVLPEDHDGVDDVEADQGYVVTPRPRVGMPREIG